MKLTNILLTAIVTGMAFSCTTEDLIDPEKKVKPEPLAGLPTTLSLRLSAASNIVTKADTFSVDGVKYARATADEQQVNNCIVAIFDVDENEKPTTLRAFLPVTTPTPITPENMTDPVTGEPVDIAYEVTGIKTTTGPAHILVVANLPVNPAATDNGFVGDGYPTEIGTEYTEFLELATQVPNSTFAANNLVKVGEVLATLDEETSTAIVPMTQLAARLDFSIKVDLPIEELPGYLSFPANADSVLSRFDKSQGIQSSSAGSPVRIVYKDTTYLGFKCDELNGQSLSYIHPETLQEIWVNNIKNSDKVIEVAMAEAEGVKGFPIDSVFKTIRWDLDVLSTTTSTIPVQTTSDVILDDFNSQQEALANVDFTFTGDGTGVLRATVYTYERNIPDEQISIRFDCKLIQGTDIKTQRYYVRLHGVWVDSNGNPQKGWNAGGLFVALSTTILAKEDDPSETFEASDSTPIILSLEATLHIDKFVHGTLYDVTATITPDLLPENAISMKDVTTKSSGVDSSPYALLFKHAAKPW